MNTRDKSRCKATPITSSPAAQQPGSSDVVSERTPRRLTPTNQRILQPSGSQLGNNLPLNTRSRSLSLSPSPKSHTMRSSSSNSNKYTHSEQVPLNLKSEIGVKTCAFESGDKNIVSPPTQSPENRNYSPDYSSSLSPSHGNREKDSKSLKTKAKNSDLKPTSKSGQQNLFKDEKDGGCHHRQSEATPLRDIFSPAPFKNQECEILFDDEEDQRRNDRANSLTESGLSFPAIKVENCEDKNKRSRDALIREKTFIVTTGRKQGSDNTDGMLHVPSSLIKKRTSNGRLVVGVNDGGIFNSLSRSEGNIPIVFHQEDATDDDPLAYREKNDQQGSLNEGQFNIRSKTHIVLNSGSHKQERISSKLHTDIVTQPNLRLYQGSNIEDVRRSIRFHSPQPQRKYEPRK